MWPFRKRDNEQDDADDATLRAAEYRVMQLRDRAQKVNHHLSRRMERNHWSETVDQLWTGRSA